jgi:YidC/Oxa1 family membrane protein insertase
MGQKTMELYKQEKVNPVSGCLPIMVQIPVFIAFYWMLLDTVELRQTAFWWMSDLSAMDPYYILPVVMGLIFTLSFGITLLFKLLSASKKISVTTSNAY